MNTNTLIGIVFGVIALVAGGYWFYASNGTEGSVADVGDAHVERASVGQKFADLLGSGQSLECTYEYNDGTNVSSGTVYIADGGERIRGDFNFTQSGAGAMQMHMLRIDGYNHMWGSSIPQGIKTAVTAENRGQLFEASDAQMGAMNENTQYKCVAWSVDPSKFSVPSDVTFMDMSDLSKMMGAPKIGERIPTNTPGSGNMDVKAMQCAACDQAGPAREQCRQALGCE